MATTVSRVAVPGVANTAFTLSAGGQRMALWVYNDTAGDLSLKAGGNASATDFTVKLVAGAFLELAEAYWINDAITAVCSVTAGAVQVTEVTS
jgi:hypothetical protein